MSLSPLEQDTYLPTAVRAQRHVRGVSVAVSSTGGKQRRSYPVWH
jgi:hypothetical protein